MAEFNRSICAMIVRDPAPTFSALCAVNRAGDRDKECVMGRLLNRQNGHIGKIEWDRDGCHRRHGVSPYKKAVHETGSSRLR